MAQFDSAELVDYLRHVFVAEDDTGLSYRVLQWSRRRCKPGGIGDTFDDSDSEREELDLSNLLTLQNVDTTTVDNSTMIRANLLAKSRAFNGVAKENCVREQMAQFAAGEFLIENHRPSTSAIPETSLTSRLIAERTSNCRSTTQFSSYARFEATSATPAASRRTMRVIFPFCRPHPVALSITIVTRPATTLADLIGLSCYVYARESRQPPCDDPALYSLYMAEEDSLQYDAELPPQDRHRLIDDCGFPTLALIKNNLATGTRRYAVTVYLFDGTNTVFRLETCDVPLQSLFERSMEWRRKAVTSDNSRNSAYKREPVYVLETLKHAGIPLTLSNTIASTGVYEFVLLRANSARGVFLRSLTDEDGIQSAGQSSRCSSVIGVDSQTPIERASHLELGHSVKALTSFGPTEALNKSEAITVRLGGHCRTNVVDCDVVLAEFTVMRRRRRMALRQLVKLRICELGVELHPVDTTRRKILIMPYNDVRILRIFWNQIVSVEVSQQEKAKTDRLIRIVWLRLSTANVPFAEPLMSELNNLNEEEMRISHNSSWKTLQLEVCNEDACSIGVKISDVLDAGSTFAQRLYQHSGGATKTPRQAAVALINHQWRGQTSESVTTEIISEVNGDVSACPDKSTASSSPTAARSRATTTTLSVTSVATRKILLNMRRMAFLRLFLKPH